jgi:S1-C subfamily serine protease
MRLILVACRNLGFLLLTLIAMVPHMALALTASQVYEHVKDSVVVVKAYDQTGNLVGLGSGVVLPSRNIATNYHVIKGGVRYTVGRGGKAAPATLKASNPEKDLCLLTTGYRFILEDETGKPDKDLCLLSSELSARPAHLGQASRLKVGDPVYAVGAPQGLELSLSEGIVSQLRSGQPPIIQTTAAISQGSSGGGLFNAEGELVGIMTFYVEGGQSLNFAVPVEWVGQLAQPVRKGPVFVGPLEVLDNELAKSAGGWLKQATELTGNQNYHGLLAHSHRWTEATPSHPLAWWYVGFAYQELSRYQEALAAYQEAVHLKPDFSSARYEIGRVYVRLGNRNAAMEAEKELRRYNPQEADRLLNLIIRP